MQQLKLFVIGFTESELKMIRGVVSLSKRREPILTLLPPEQALKADIFLIDGTDETAIQWAAAHPSLKQRPVIWIDGVNMSTGHLAIRRPVQWTQLPMLISNELEKKSFDDNDFTLQTGTTPTVAHTTADTALSTDSQTRQPRLSTAANPTQDTTRLAASTSGTKKHVLVVDDSQIARDYLAHILIEAGYEVTFATTGSEAIQVFQPNVHQLVFMDVVMPEMDGYEACRLMKDSLRGKANIPVVMLTNKSSPFDKIHAKMAGCDAYLVKPVALPDLQRILQHFIP